MKLKINIAVFRLNIICYFKDYGKQDRLAVTEVEEGFSPVIKFNTRNPIPIPAIPHELLHALRYELGYKRGVDGLQYSNDEVLPYCLEYAMGKILDFINKNNIVTCRRCDEVLED